MTPVHGRPLGQLHVAPRFNGPPNSANGGYVSGSLAAFLPGGGAVQVTLRQPPPLNTPLSVVPSAAGVAATFGGTLIAEAVRVPLAVNPVDPVSAEAAARAAQDYAGWTRHPFPTCFACGTEREAPDGLGLRPGPLPDRPGITACPWVPADSATSGAAATNVTVAAGPGASGVGGVAQQPPAQRASGAAATNVTVAAGPGASGVGGVAQQPPAQRASGAAATNVTVGAEIVWAALDCPGGWAAGIAGRPAVLGRMTAQLDVLPAPGEPCLVMGELLEVEGRKSFTATTLYDSEGRVMARAAATWIAVDPASFGAVSNQT